MRCFTVAIVALVVGCCLFTTTTAEEQQKCVPGSQFMDDEQCNTCFCGDDGQTVSCTKKKCIKLPLTSDRVQRDVKQVCEPGSRFKDVDGCNWCTCNSAGTLAACTRKFCFKKDRQIDTQFRTKREIKKCTPGENFLAEDGCNHCFCNADGTPGGCTEKLCFDNLNIQHSRQTREVEKCEPGSRFLDADGCNWCTCSADGKMAACTRKFCITKPKIDRVARKAGNYCAPGSTFKQDCNTCRCSDDGKNAACTFKFCIPGGGRVRRGVEEAEKQICVPNSSFRDAEDCNNCFCNEKGTAAACTLKLCLPLPRVTRSTVCEPNSTFKNDCNTCHCNAEGTASTCTEIGCPRKTTRNANEKEEEKDKVVGAQPTPCTPDDIKIEGCNRCKCAKNGIVWLCTPGSACAPNGNNGNGQ